MGRENGKLAALVRARVVPSGPQAELLERMQDGWRLFVVYGCSWWMERKGCPPLLVHHKVANGALGREWIAKLREDAKGGETEHTITMAGQGALARRKRCEAG